MNVRSYVTADVFTDRRFGGNPLAVFPDGAGLDGALMQSIARELNLSETVFVLPPETSGGTRRLRIFTPAMELPFAGHPTVGTAVLLAEAGAFGDASEIVFEEGAGPVPVRLERGSDGRVRATLTSPRLPAEVPGLPGPEDLARVIGLPASALAVRPAPAAWSAGVCFAVIPLRERSALSAARLDPAAWSASMAEGPAPHIYPVWMEDWERGGDVHVRMFAPAMGIPEDPATGAAAAALVGFLAALRRSADGVARWRVLQGMEMGRPSEIAISAVFAGGRLEAAMVGGGAVTVAKATLELDPP
ncbi:PhzF family phenazine biosynthesis protein [Arenibaculum pallidiluteum]|uniref:PhzF family phenazine biosynthesis protein n=1 Tax=Arenibaculum pallidiluteum TaxID=2812559 RepID=UPI001A96B877|nr:PhzF family phenazine biosynthesis protein [Arenibaculum pallidiluteum]